MKILVTAGNTQTPIDSVRCLTNIFTGRTGASVATSAAERGHDVVLFTSHPEAVDALRAKKMQIRDYRTFDDLQRLMAETIPSAGFEAIVHAAAVSDYLHAGTFATAPDTQFDASGSPKLIDVSAGKIKSHHPELLLRLTPAPKLIDSIREPWGFRGVLVKFKLEVGLSREALLEVAEKSRLQSTADLMVANTLEGRNKEAFIGAGDYQRVARGQLSRVLLTKIEALFMQRER